MIKYLDESNEFLAYMIIGIDECDIEDFLNEVSAVSVIDPESISDMIEEGVVNGYSAEKQMKKVREMYGVDDE